MKEDTGKILTINWMSPPGNCDFEDFGFLYSAEMLEPVEGATDYQRKE